MYNLYSQETCELVCVVNSYAAAVLAQMRNPDLFFYQEPTFTLDEVEDNG